MFLLFKFLIAECKDSKIILVPRTFRGILLVHEIKTLGTTAVQWGAWCGSWLRAQRCSAWGMFSIKGWGCWEVEVSLQKPPVISGNTHNLRLDLVSGWVIFKNGIKSYVRLISQKLVQSLFYPNIHLARTRIWGNTSFICSPAAKYSGSKLKAVEKNWG